MRHRVARGIFVAGLFVIVVAALIEHLDGGARKNDLEVALLGWAALIVAQMVASRRRVVPVEGAAIIGVALLSLLMPPETRAALLFVSAVLGGMLLMLEVLPFAEPGRPEAQRPGPGVMLGFLVGGAIAATLGWLLADLVLSFLLLGYGLAAVITFMVLAMMYFRGTGPTAEESPGSA